MVEKTAVLKVVLMADLKDDSSVANLAVSKVDQLAHKWAV